MICISRKTISKKDKLHDNYTYKQKIQDALEQIKSGKKDKVTIILDNPNYLHNKSYLSKSYLRVLYNKIIYHVSRKITPSHFKNWLLNTTGMNIGYDACIPHNHVYDPYFPELIHIGKGSIVGGCTTLLSHTLEDNKLVIGTVKIGERTLIGGMCTLYPGASIGKNSLLTSDSELHTKIPDAEIWFGKPAKLVSKMDSVELDKYFLPSNGKCEEYYKEYYDKLQTFKNDKTQSFFKIQYNGKHLNAGMDWWRARNIIGIFWSGFIVESTLNWKPSRFKNFILRLTGAKIGKNVKIGKGVILDHLLTNMITIEDNVVLEDNVYLDAHEYTISQTIFGKTLVKKGAHIKSNVFTRAGTIVGENSIIEENSFISRVIPDNEIWSGQPAKCIRKLNETNKQE